MWRTLSYIKNRPWQVIGGVIRWMPLVLSFAFVYFLAGRLGMVPSSWNCQFYHVKTISLLSIDFDVSTADCFLGPFYSEQPTVVRASQRGDWFQTKIFEYGGVVDVEIDSIDAHTIRIAMSAQLGDGVRKIDVHEVYAEKSEWRGVEFVYEQADPDERAK